MDLRTSYSESDEIRRTLHNTRNEIENVRKRIKLTMGEIEKANALLEELQTTEKELQQTAEAAAHLLSPFKRIPLDIIGSLVEHVTSSNITIPYTDQSIWPLTYVCSSWRNAILSLPHLWSTFAIIGRLDPHLNILSTVLTRSGSHHPLSFSMPLASSVPLQTEAIHLLVKHSERWKRVHLRIDAKTPPILLKLYANLPLLESLKLDLTEPPRELAWSDSDAGQHIFEHAPNLTTLGIPYQFFPIGLHFPTHQLLHLISTWDVKTRKIGIWDLEDLTRFPKLLTLDVTESKGSGSSATDFIEHTIEHTQVLLPSLTHLRLVRVEQLITAFELPSLLSLDLYGVDHSLPAVHKLLDKLRPGQLETFRATVLVDGDTVEELLSHPALTRIRSLALKHRRPSLFLAPFLSRATFRCPSRHPPPHADAPTPVSGGKVNESIPLAFLRHLTIDFVYPKQINWISRVLEEFITSRTSLIDMMREPPDHEGGLELNRHAYGEGLIPPVRLEVVRIWFAEFGRPITIENFRHFFAEMTEFRVQGMT